MEIHWPFSFPLPFPRPSYSRFYSSRPQPASHALQPQPEDDLLVQQAKSEGEEGEEGEDTMDVDPRPQGTGAQQQGDEEQPRTITMSPPQGPPDTSSQRNLSRQQQEAGAPQVSLGEAGEGGDAVGWQLVAQGGARGGMTTPE